MKSTISLRTLGRCGISARQYVCAGACVPLQRNGMQLMQTERRQLCKVCVCSSHRKQPDPLCHSQSPLLHSPLCNHQLHVCVCVCVCCVCVCMNESVREYVCEPEQVQCTQQEGQRGSSQVCVRLCVGVGVGAFVHTCNERPLEDLTEWFQRKALIPTLVVACVPWWSCCFRTE